MTRERAGAVANGSIALVGLFCAFAACNDAPPVGSAGGHPSPAPRPIDPARERMPGTKPIIVLVTMDGVRWQDVFEGTDAVLSHAPSRPATELMPNLHRLAKERGAAIGAPGRGVMSAVGPNYVSLPGYIEILSGRRSIKCQDNDCRRTDDPTFL